MSLAGSGRLSSFADSRAARLTDLLRGLVRIPSENSAPRGTEARCQEYVAKVLEGCGWAPQLYTPDEAPGIQDHPLYWPGRIYRDRPNLGARRAGSGGGRSLILSGHIDTVPAGSSAWTRDPFGATIEGGRLYGRGANDMKAGIAAHLFVLECLAELGIRLKGDLLFETVVDEEFGGVNGTLAGRLMGFHADAAIIGEATALRVCPAQRGGRTVHLTFRAPNNGILGAPIPSAIDQLRVFLNAVTEFAAVRKRKAPRHALYAHLSDPVPAQVTRVSSAPWGSGEPTNLPTECRVEFFWQTMPGETLEAADAEFFAWFEQMLQSNQAAFPARPDVAMPIRWLPGSAISPSEPLVEEMRRTAASVLNTSVPVEGIEGPCDLYVFHEFGVPGILWGARGGNTHNPDEYVELDSVLDSAKVLLHFICRWCGVAEGTSCDI